MKFYTVRFYLFIALLFLLSCYSKPCNIKEGIEIETSSQYENSYTDFLLDNNDSTYWNSGKAGHSRLVYFIEKPVFIDSIDYYFVTDRDIISDHKIYYKTKGRNDSILLYSTKLSNQNEVKIPVNKDDICMLIFEFDSKTSWIAINSLNIFGKYKNWIKVW